MDQEPIPPPDFTLPDFAALVELTMAEQEIDCDKAIVFLEQCWEQTGLRGVHLNWDNDRDAEGDEDAPHPQEEDPPRGNHGQAGQPVDATQPAGMQTITFDPDACIATTLTARPVDYAIKRIEAHKHVLLWYFSREGLWEAAREVRQLDENERTFSSRP